MSAALDRRRSGVLLPLAAVPARFGVGDVGPAARRFVRWLGDAGQSWWQMLPVTPLGPGGSPYDSPSAFAGEPAYLSLEDLAEEGLLLAAALRAPKSLGAQAAQVGRATKWKLAALEQAFEAWSKQGGAKQRAFRAFCADQAHWLAAFEDYEGRAPGFTAFLQFQFDRQWARLRKAAREAKVQLLGDVPIFVAAGSSDVQSRPELFRLGRNGEPTVVSGCPPDAFSDDGQLWGHPHYRWSAHRAEGFGWWRARVRRQLELFDALRIDHFIGFVRAWEVPAAAATAAGGKWGRSAGDEVLAALEGELGPLPLVAEDLGAVTPPVRRLADRHGLPGMRVLQWGFGAGSEHAPYAVPQRSVVYPGTHDNDTTAGWWRGLEPATRTRVRTALGCAASEVPWALWRCASGTAANLAVVQLQDLLGLGRSTRTNTPGTTVGNWRWRPQAKDLSAHLARRCRALALATDRLPTQA